MKFINYKFYFVSGEDAMATTTEKNSHDRIGPYQAIQIVADGNFRELNPIFSLKFM